MMYILGRERGAGRPCCSLIRSVQKVNQANMLLLEELRKSPSEKSAGRQCSNEPGIKTPSGTLYLCGIGDASLRKHSTIYCGLRLLLPRHLQAADQPPKAFHDILWIKTRAVRIVHDTDIKLRKHSTIHCGLRP